jgi:glycosyltransferase involved in cell wall biosynthesis
LDLREEGQMPKLIATVPVRDEEWILPKTLADLSLYVDEIVVLDDGSTDRTPKIIRSFPKVTSIHTNPIGTKPFGNGQESVNRNRLLDMARARGAEVILQIDADEIFSDSIKTDLPKLLAQRSSVKFQICHLYGDINHFRVDADYGNFFRYRLYWMNRRLRFTPQPIIATPRAFDRKHKITCHTAKIVHFGWINPNIRSKHMKRYFEVYKMKNPGKSVSFEEFSSSEAMQAELRIVKQDDSQVIVRTWAEIMDQESQEKYRL